MKLWNLWPLTYGSVCLDIGNSKLLRWLLQLLPLTWISWVSLQFFFNLLPKTTCGDKWCNFYKLHALLLPYQQYQKLLQDGLRPQNITLIRCVTLTFELNVDNINLNHPASVQCGKCLHLLSKCALFICGICHMFANFQCRERDEWWPFK